MAFNKAKEEYKWKQWKEAEEYAGTVYFLYTDGKCVPAFKRQLAVPHGGSMETLPGRNFTV